MSELIRITRTPTFFERTIDDIINKHFFSSFDSNIKEQEKGYEIEVSVPGMTKKDLQLHLENGVLYLKGERTSSSNSWLRKKDFTEFNSTLLQQSFMLPDDADNESIKAKCKNGLLKILIRKKESNSLNISVSDKSDGKEALTWIEQLKSKKLFQQLRKPF
jgi:HSP20 family protein